MDSIPAAESDVYNLQDSTGGLDSQGFGLSSQSSADTTYQPAADVADSPGTGSTFPFNQQVNWGCQPFAGVGKRPLVSPGSSPVKQKPRVSHTPSYLMQPALGRVACICTIACCVLHTKWQQACIAMAGSWLCQERLVNMGSETVLSKCVACDACL